MQDTNAKAAAEAEEQRVQEQRARQVSIYGRCEHTLPSHRSHLSNELPPWDQGVAMLPLLQRILLNE